ncbi:MAG: hypothetical protein FJ240_13960 [Nitrospira sp.]|nr:hypothetical protein [Nitrospira sp.]
MAWLSGIVPSRDTGSFGVYSISAIPFLLTFENVTEALPLPSLKVMLSLRSNWYNMGNSDSRADPMDLRFLISAGCPKGHRNGPPVFIVVWLPLRVTPDIPEVHLSVMAVIVKIDASAFPYL